MACDANEKEILLMCINNRMLDPFTYNEAYNIVKQEHGLSVIQNNENRIVLNWATKPEDMGVLVYKFQLELGAFGF